MPSPGPGGITAEQLQELQQQMGSPGEDGSGTKGGLSSEKLQELLKRMSNKSAPASPAPPASAP